MKWVPVSMPHSHLNENLPIQALIMLIILSTNSEAKQKGWVLISSFLLTEV